MNTTPIHSLITHLLNYNVRTPNVAVEAKTEYSTHYASIKNAFDEVSKSSAGSVVTMATCKRVINYMKLLASREEHLNFFGGNLMGTDRIRYFDQDRYKWFDEVIQLDESFLQEAIYSVDPVYTDRKVASDAFNLSIIWFVHMCMSTLNSKDKTVQLAMSEALILLQFKLLSSLYSNQFDKPVDNAAAEAVYSALSMKFALKRLGSWGEVLKWRAEAFLDKTGPHFHDIVKFNNDDRIMYVLTDISTRIRKSIKDQYKILDQVRSGNLRIETGSSRINIAGDDIIKDRVTSYNTAKLYLLDVSGNESSFIKQDLLSVVLDIMSTTSKQALLDILSSMARTPTGKKREVVESMMEDTVLHAFDYIARERIQFNDVGYIINKMRALYMSSKTSDPRLLSLRKRLEDYAKKHSSLRASSALSSVRTATMLYFLIRALSSNVYK